MNEKDYNFLKDKFWSGNYEGATFHYTDRLVRDELISFSVLDNDDLLFVYANRLISCTIFNEIFYKFTEYNVEENGKIMDPDDLDIWWKSTYILKGDWDTGLEPYTTLESAFGKWAK